MRFVVGLAAFVFFVVPWMGAAIWLFRLPGGLRLGAPPTPWRPLTDYPEPRRDQRREVNRHDAGSDDGSGRTGGDKHAPLATA